MTRLLAAWPTAEPLEVAVLVFGAVALGFILTAWVSVEIQAWWHKRRSSEDWNKEGRSPWFL